MIHLGKNHDEAANHLEGHFGRHSNNTYRGRFPPTAKAENARNFTQCDSLLIGNHCGAHTVRTSRPTTRQLSSSTRATTSKEFPRTSSLM